jgi:hypothetical protein
MQFFRPLVLFASIWSTACLANVSHETIQARCIQCHGKDGEVKGKVNLLAIKSDAEFAEKPELLADVIEALEYEEMPPEDEEPLPPATREAMVRELKALLRQTVEAEPAFAQAPIRRMNRFQYSNAVQDLLDLKVLVFTLPERMMRSHSNYFSPATKLMPDKVRVGSRPLGKSQMIEQRLDDVVAFPQDLRAEHGFDNQGDHLSLSPLLMESFLALSRSIVQSPDFTAKNVGIWAQFFAEPKDDVPGTTQTRLKAFLTHAFRRPIEAATLARYGAYVLARLDAGLPYPEAMKELVSAVLASPNFLYIYDRAGKAATAQPLDDFDLASRLSFFLWGSVPDDELLSLAARGELTQTLDAQLTRMLADTRLKRFCDSFPAQWLQLERIISSVPDTTRFKSFFFASPNYRTSMDMMLEPLLLFETLLIEDKSILQLVDSDFSYRSPRLTSWYAGKVGGGGPTVLNFERVSIEDRRQGGVITSAAILTMNSGPHESKPITRGAWVASVIFNDPPEPPPADVPPLPGVKADTAKLTLRERLSAHRERADCAGCHEKLDPLGFALENYNAVGQWRDSYENGRKVDMGGVLFRKHKFDSIVAFKDAILAEKGRFTRGFAGHVLAFALGRELTAADSLALDRIRDETAASDYRMQALIRSVVHSAPFTSKTNPKDTP